MLILTLYVAWDNVVLIYKGFYFLTTFGRLCWCNILVAFSVEIQIWLACTCMSDVLIFLLL